jgi:hypothetical protein
MANFAELNENNIVTRVLVTDNSFPNQGYDWLVENLGGTWIKTFYNSKIRKNFAGVGHRYDSILNGFIAPQPYASWQLNNELCSWEAPTPYPEDNLFYWWNETELSWVEMPGKE